MAKKDSKPERQAKKTFVRGKPNFISLKNPGDSCQGIFIGVTKTQYGPGYKFRPSPGVKASDDDPQSKPFILSGNRAQLDALFLELMEESEIASGMELRVRRTDDVTSRRGMNVASYEIDLL